MTGEPKGTLVVDTGSHFLYLVLGNGYAIRYGVGLGRAGFEWSGRAEIGAKREWPKWFPPDEMVDREPKLEKYRVSYDKQNDVYNGGMEPGITNPLGARALYLYQDGKYTLCTIYSTVMPQTIGTGVSSGCVGLLTQDMMHLYARAPVDTNVVILPA